MTTRPGNPASAAPEQRVLKGRYVLDDELGRGAMATVYRATDTRLDREVAVKVLPTELSREPEFVQQFLAMETRIAGLYHPNVVTIFDAGVEDDCCFVVMQHLSGGSVRDRLTARGAFDVADAVRVMAQAADALGHLHAQGIIHGDVKPDNLLFDDGGDVKLVDFGIARIATTTGALDAKTLEGTTPYLAPEQVSGGPVDQRVDIYALGLVAYELLAGHRAFEGDDWIAVATDRLERSPDPLSMLRADVPSGVEAAIRRALARDPDERFASAQDFGSALIAGAAPSNPDGAVPPTDDSDTPRPSGDTSAGSLQQAAQGLVETPGRNPAKAQARYKPKPAGRPGLTPTHWLNWVYQIWQGIEVSDTRVRMLLAAVGGMLILSVLLILVWPRLVNPPHPVSVPQLTGQTLEAARSTAHQVGLDVAPQDEASDSVARGTVIGQEPAASTTTQSDQPVRVMVSSGPPPVRVPDLTGRRVDDASRDLAAIGLTLGTVDQRETSSSAPSGTIVEQNTPSGSEVARGGSVNVVVGVPPMTSAPALVDKALGDAEAELDKRGLHLGAVSQQPVADKRAGTVTAQDPAPDVRLRQGDQVSVTIAVPPLPSQ
jgi:serine/threonine-protein kinase